MTVHLFGASSSPGCANFALKSAASAELFGTEASNFVTNDFYVDDGLKSVQSPAEAIELIKNSDDLCKAAGFNLHKYVSNDKEVLKSVPVEKRAKDIQAMDLSKDQLPVERTLGIQWFVESDTFQFRVLLHDKPFTRRGILSSISSIFDPLGLVSPFLLRGKRIMQEICSSKADWDDPVPDEVRVKWESWREDLLHLSEIDIPRCYKPTDFGELKKAELHNFSDASLEGYGQCSYLRLIDVDGKVSSSLVMSKARVTPSKPVTVPRLELSAALISAKVGTFLADELDFKNLVQFYYTDSKVVLGYITNESKRFHIFVANRVQQIREFTKPTDWTYIDTNANPADIASRGLGAKELVNSTT